MILRNEEHDRQDMRSNLEHKIAARILKRKMMMSPKRQINPSSQVWGRLGRDLLPKGGKALPFQTIILRQVPSCES